MGITWDWETFPEFIDAAARRQPVAQSGLPRAADAVPPLRDGRGVDGARGHARRDGADQGARWARRSTPAPSASRRTILNQHMGFEGRPLACRNASRDELKAYANALKERGKGAIEIALTRKIAVMDDEEYELLDFLLTRERPARDLPRAVRPRRHPGGGARHPAQGGAAHRARRAAADLAPAADARHQHAQPVLLRGLPELEAGVRRQVETGPGRGLRRSRLPQPVPRGAEAAHGLRQLGAHQRARGPVARAQGARGPLHRRHRPRAGQGRRRCLPGPDARRTTSTSSSPWPRSTRGSTA